VEICEGNPEYGIKLVDYEYVQPKQVSLEQAPTADPLGQQARLESSIPKSRIDSAIYNDSMFSDKEWVLLIQKKLSLLGGYEGPFDGVWNKDIEVHIQQILDQNLIYFEAVKSAKALELLGIVN
jgi:hypothetical protein